MTDVARQDGARYRFPIPHLEAAYALDQEVAQSTAVYAPAQFSIPSTAYGLSDANAVLQAEAQMSNMGSGVSRWLRSFFIVPETWNDWEMLTYTFPSFIGYEQNPTIAYTAPISGENSVYLARFAFTKSVLCRLQNDYFMVGIVPRGATYDGSGNYSFACSSGVSMTCAAGVNDTTINGISFANLAIGTYAAGLNGYPYEYGYIYITTLTPNTNYIFTPGANETAICVGGTISGSPPAFNPGGVWPNQNPVITVKGKYSFNSGSNTTCIVFGTVSTASTAQLYNAASSALFTSGSSIALTGTANSLVTAIIGPAINDSAGRPVTIVNNEGDIQTLTKMTISVVNNPGVISESVVPAAGYYLNPNYFYPTTPSWEQYNVWINNAATYGWASTPASLIPGNNLVPTGKFYSTSTMAIPGGNAYYYILPITLLPNTTYLIALNNSLGASSWYGILYNGVGNTANLITLTTGATVHPLYLLSNTSGAPIYVSCTPVLPPSVGNPGQIIAEDSTLKRYAGSIWVRQSRWILAL